METAQPALMRGAIMLIERSAGARRHAPQVFAKLSGSSRARMGRSRLRDTC